MKKLQNRNLWLFTGLFSLALLLSACQREPDLYIYEVNPVESAPVSTAGDKGQLKTDEQFISILYASLFQQALSASELIQITELIQSIGDKETAYEVIISNWMNSPAINLPTEADMRNDLDGFIVNTYQKFYVRQPTQAETEFFRNYINSDPNITPELVYLSFALSNEYLYY